MKTRYDTQKPQDINSKEGDKVWFYNPTRRKGLSLSYNRIGTRSLYNFKDNKRRRNPDPNGVLYRKFESEDGKTFRWQLVLPRSRIPEVLKELHGSPTGGHFGVMKTLHRVRERFCWGKVRADVEQWCKSVMPVQLRKGPKIRSRGKLHRYNVGHPSNVSLSISWDLCQGLRLEAPTVAEAVVQHWISRYGVPLQLHSDPREEISSLRY
ncbi:retrovirus-related Pol polyprotein from transposon 412 [Trichonephila clavipes]|nr:retrovirus-related Pol polyprotein from transposon 412 [Trichonephila clavipes]